MARQICPALRIQGSHRKHGELMNRDRPASQGNLGSGVVQDNQLKALHRDLDLASLAACVGHLPLMGDLAVAFILGRGLQIGDVDDIGYRGGRHPSLGQDLDDTLEQGLQITDVQSHSLLAQPVWTEISYVAWPLPCGCALLESPPAHLLGIEADQAHQGLTIAQPGRQGIHAVYSEQSLHSIKQDRLDDRYPVELDPCTADDSTTPSSCRKWKKLSSSAP